MERIRGGSTIGYILRNTWAGRGGAEALGRVEGVEGVAPLEQPHRQGELPPPL